MNLITDAFKMIRDIRGTTRAIRAWGGLLNMTQIVGGVLFIVYLEAQIVLATVLVTLMIAGQIHKRTPFSRLTGLCHVPWLALLPWLLYRLQTEEHDLYFSSWGYAVCLLIFVSLVFDVLDVVRYANGARTFAWSRSHERPH